MSRRVLSPVQFVHVDDLHPRTNEHPSTFIGDDEEYNGKWNNPDNPAPAYERLKKSIARRGVLTPLNVDRETGRTVLDGHHRLAAAKELGLTHVPVRPI